MAVDNEIKFLTVDHIDDSLLRKAASLHVEHLSYRSFITLFGNKFIHELYKDILNEHFGFFVFAVDSEKVCGFVLGCMNSSKLFKVILKNLSKYLKIIFPEMIKHPTLIMKFFETLLYINKENTSTKAELVVIITDTHYRAHGLGSQLVDILNKEFSKRGVSQYKVTVHDEMKRSNNFYIKNGMKFIKSFNMYNLKWNLYVNNI